MIDTILQVLITGYTPFILFFIWSFFSLLVGLVRIYEYIVVQRVPSTILFAMVNLCQAVALGIGALLLAPHPLDDFEWLRSWSRLAWAVGLLFFLPAVPVHVWYVGNIVWLRYKARLKAGLMALPVASLEDK